MLLFPKRTVTNRREKGMESVLEFKHISKFFPGVKALDDICFKAYGGEVLAFLGENGAGKSTLLKVLNGDYKPDVGEYLLDGEQKAFRSPQEATFPSQAITDFHRNFSYPCPLLEQK